MSYAYLVENNKVNIRYNKNIKALPQNIEIIKPKNINNTNRGFKYQIMILYKDNNKLYKIKCYLNGNIQLTGLNSNNDLNPFSGFIESFFNKFHLIFYWHQDIILLDRLPFL